MARKGGNPKCVGNKNSGRKKVKKERQELIWILEKWQNPEELQKIIKKYQTGKPCSLREIYVAKAALGSESILNKISDKILPDKLEWSTDDEEKGNLKDALEYAEFKIAKALGRRKTSTDNQSVDMG